MTERTDMLLYETFCKAPPGDFGNVAAWREYRDDLYAALKLLDKRLEEADREEYEALQKRMQELQARMGRDFDEGPGAGVMSIARGAEDGRPAPQPPKPEAAPQPVKRKPWKCGICDRTTDAEVCPRCKEMTAPPSYADTDAGAGVGGREPPMTTEEFREQLVGLRDRVTDRRARLGLG